MDEGVRESVGEMDGEKEMEEPEESNQASKRAEGDEPKMKAATLSRCCAHGAHTRRAQTGSTRRVAGGAPDPELYSRHRRTGEVQERTRSGSRRLQKCILGHHSQRLTRSDR